MIDELFPATNIPDKGEHMKPKMYNWDVFPKENLYASPGGNLIVGITPASNEIYMRQITDDICNMIIPSANVGWHMEYVISIYQMSYAIWKMIFMCQMTVGIWNMIIPFVK